MTDIVVFLDGWDGFLAMLISDVFEAERLKISFRTDGVFFYFQF